MGLGAVAGATLAAGALGAGASLMGSQAQAGAAKDAANLNKMMYMMTRGDLSPFVGAGAATLPNLLSLATSGPTGGGRDYVDLAYQNLPLQMTQQQLEQTPGYQFTLAQGLKSVQSANAAKGLGVSGAALKGAAEYATGLADKTYANRFNEAQQRFTDYLNLNSGQQANLTNQYNRLSGLATIGGNAAAQVGTQGTQLANQAGRAEMAAGTAQGSGLMNAANSLTGAVQNYLGYDAFQKYMNPTGGTGGYPTGPGTGVYPGPATF